MHPASTKYRCTFAAYLASRLQRVSPFLMLNTVPRGSRHKVYTAHPRSRVNRAGVRSTEPATRLRRAAFQAAPPLCAALLHARSRTTALPSFTRPVRGKTPELSGSVCAGPHSDEAANLPLVHLPRARQNCRSPRTSQSSLFFPSPG